MSNTLKDLAHQLEGKRHELKAFLSEIKGVPTDDQKTELEKRESELADIKGKYESARKVEDLANENDEALKGLSKVNRLPIATELTASSTKTLGQLIVESGALKMMNTETYVGPNVNIKTVLSTGAGYPPFSPRDNTIAQYPTRALTLLDVIPTQSWNYASYIFPQETTFTNSADDIAESVQGTLSAYPESALVAQNVTVPMRKVATFIPVTDEQLSDFDGMAAYLDSRLAYMVKAKFEGQLIAGDGVSPNMQGMLNVSGIQTQAKGSDSVPDAIYKAITKVRVNAFVEPTHILMHPNDFQDVRILQSTTGQYLWDNMTVPGASTFYGMPIILSTAVTEGTSIVLDLNQCVAMIRQGVDVQVGYANADFTNGMKSVRADIRGNLVVYRAPAICKVTGV